MQLTYLIIKYFFITNAESLNKTYKTSSKSILQNNLQMEFRYLISNIRRLVLFKKATVKLL